MSEQVLEKLLQFPVFQPYDRERLRWLEDKLSYVHVKSGDIVLSQGEPPERCYLLIEGQLRVSKQVEEYEVPLDELSPGAFCGEISLLTGTPTTALVRAVKDSLLICLEEADFFRLLEACPATERTITRMMAERVRRTEMATWQKERDALLKIEYDVQTAKRIQLGFLPGSLPQPSGWQIASCFHPALKVAGDFYDSFLMVRKRRLALVIADVCDKGVGSALFMALSRSLLRAYAEQNQTLSRSFMDALSDTTGKQLKGLHARDVSSAELSIGTSVLLNAVTSTNDYIVENHAEMNMFVTVFFGMLDPIAGTLLYVNAGHEAPYIVGKDGFKDRLKPTGPAIGLFPDVTFKLGVAHLDPGDILFTYTDGVPDARDPAGKRLGRERLEQLLSHPMSSAQELISRIEENLFAHRGGADQFDDITMLVAQRSYEQDQ